MVVNWFGVDHGVSLKIENNKLISGHKMHTHDVRSIETVGSLVLSARGSS